MGWELRTRNQTELFIPLSFPIFFIFFSIISIFFNLFSIVFNLFSIFFSITWVGSWGGGTRQCCLFRWVLSLIVLSFEFWVLSFESITWAGSWLYFCYGSLLLRSSTIKNPHLILHTREGTRGLKFVTQT